MFCTFGTYMWHISFLIYYYLCLSDCPVSFEFQNYTIITSKCKGLKFPASQCCAALKEFACPFYMYLNDDSNSCASTMFTYINLNGKYPPGLFSSECKEGKLGLSCADVPQRDISAANGGERAQLLAWIVLSVVVASLFHWMITPFICPKDRVFQLMRLWVWSLHLMVLLVG